MINPESSTAVTNAASFGQVYDRGYLHYDGERLGRKYAFWALVKYSMLRALGARKSWTAKVMPVLMYVAVAFTVIIPLGIIAFIPDATVVQYWEFFGGIYLITAVFIAGVAPEMLCTDRREKVMPLYFSRAMKPTDYVFAKLIATALLTLSLSLIPAFVYWLGRQLLDDDPVNALINGLDDLAKLMVVAVLIALYLGSIGLAIASTTTRTIIAAAAIVVALIVGTAFVEALTMAFEGDEIQRYLVVLSPLGITEEMANAAFGHQIEFSSFGESFDTWVYMAVMIVTTVLCTTFTVWRYRPRD